MIGTKSDLVERTLARPDLHQHWTDSYYTGAGVNIISFSIGESGVKPFHTEYIKPGGFDKGWT